MSDPVLIPFDAVAKFIRLHTHDMRNELNALDLEATLLADCVPEGEAAEAVQQLRRQLRRTATQLRDLSARFTAPSPQIAPWSARELFEHCRQCADKLDPPPAVEVLSWKAELGEEQVSADLEAFAAAWLELLRNALVFREPGAALEVRTASTEREVVFALHETKASAPDFSQWGVVPFLTTRRDGYGLGLYHAQRILTAQGAKVTRRFDEGQLVTSVALERAAAL